MEEAMELKVGQLVYSRAGRDRGKFLAVVDITEKGVFIADGKERPLEPAQMQKPKAFGGHFHRIRQRLNVHKPSIAAGDCKIHRRPPN